nr:TIGR02594 family protein [Bacteroidota bacterium]
VTFERLNINVPEQRAELSTEGLLTQRAISNGTPSIEVGELTSNTKSYMEIAKGYRGLNEANNSDDIYRLFQEPIGLNCSDAWCSGYANRVFSDVGVDGTGSGMARSWLNWGTSGMDPCKVLDPQYGMVAVFSRGTNPLHGHVGFVVGREGNNLLLLGGNQSYSVRVSPYPISRLLGLRWY